MRIWIIFFKRWIGRKACYSYNSVCTLISLILIESPLQGSKTMVMLVYKILIKRDANKNK